MLRLNAILLLIFVFGLQYTCQAQPKGFEPPFELPQPTDLKKLRTAIVYTDRGQIHFKLFPESAPWHVANFKYLADKGFYKDLTFHIREPKYIIQGGDPTGTGNGGPNYFIPGEFNTEKHTPGALGMARAGDVVNPERLSHGSQFYIILGNSPHMDGLYTVFGRITKGMEVAQALRRGDRIRDVKVFVGR